MRSIGTHGTDEQKALLRKGQEYEQFIGRKLGVEFYESVEDQYEKGESPLGMEVKFDDRCAKTGNLYLETAEKTDPTNEEYVPSGILREDNTWLWLIGDYKRSWCFLKDDLLDLAFDLPKVETPTSRGVLLPIVAADKVARKKWEWA